MPRYLKLWKAGIPLKIRAFLWLVLNHRVLTRDVMGRKGWIGDHTCSLCGAADETASHLFLQCPQTQLLWSWVHSQGDWHLNLTSLDELWEGCQTLTGNELRNHLTLLGALLWVVWGERNRLTFTPDTSIKPTRSLTALICSHIILWTGGRVGGPVILPEATSSDEE